MISIILLLLSLFLFLSKWTSISIATSMKNESKYIINTPSYTEMIINEIMETKEQINHKDLNGAISINPFDHNILSM